MTTNLKTRFYHVLAVLTTKLGKGTQDIDCDGTSYFWKWGGFYFSSFGGYCYLSYNDNTLFTLYGDESISNPGLWIDRKWNQCERFNRRMKKTLPFFFVIVKSTKGKALFNPKMKKAFITYWQSFK